jgi:oligopeptide/dipeptide ABC transporter ATP-binding protein
MTDELLQVRGLKTYFNTFAGVIKAVDAVDFCVNKGEILGLVGESGCGKSVVGFSIMDLIEPPGRIEAGEIRFNGMNLPDLDERRMRKIRGKEIAMVFQDPMTSLNPLYTIQNQMEEVMKLHGDMSAERRKDRCIELLAEVGISQPETRLKNYPHQFSGGMRQRVIIAIALASAPKLVIADEPTTALDVTIQSQILKLMKRPYTLGLLGSIPKLASRQKRLLQIPGMVPDIMNLPPGCAFAPRCSYAQERCRIMPPELEDLKPGHKTACYYPVER